jgi:hypothetical protein
MSMNPKVPQYNPTSVNKGVEVEQLEGIFQSEANDVNPLSKAKKPAIEACML